MNREPEDATRPPSPPLSPPLPLRPTAAAAVAAATATPTSTTATPAASRMEAGGAATRGGTAPEYCRGEVELRNVEFKYPSRRATKRTCCFFLLY